MMLIDTHAHIHFHQHGTFAGYDVPEILKAASEAGVGKLLTVGVDPEDSQRAVEAAHRFPNVWATVGLHPHDAKLSQAALSRIAELARDDKVVAIGECGLDYFKAYSTKAEQLTAFRAQIELALEVDKPMVWHVRDAFDDFFEVVDRYEGLRGVVHSFTSNRANMKKAVDRGFYIALNGIMTFTKDADQLAAARAVPLERLALETDCPFLAPVPHRGQPNQPAFIADTAKFLAELRGDNLEELSTATTKNAETLFGI